MLSDNIHNQLRNVFGSAKCRLLRWQNPDMSRKILEWKMTGFKATGADYLVTSCPACAMQLEFGMRSHGLKGEVVHPVELLAKAMGPGITL